MRNKVSAELDAILDDMRKLSSADLRKLLDEHKNGQLAMAHRQASNFISSQQTRKKKMNIFNSVIVMWLISTIISLSVMAGLVYVAFHFIGKFW